MNKEISKSDNNKGIKPVDTTTWAGWWRELNWWEKILYYVGVLLIFQLPGILEFIKIIL